MRTLIFTALLLCGALACAQEPSSKMARVNAAPPTVRLRVQSRIDLPATLAGAAYADPLRCDENGTLYTQFVSPTFGVASPEDGLQGIVGISRDGKITRFSLPRDSRIEQPIFVSAYPAAGSVVVHLRGRTDTKLRVMQRKVEDRVVDMGAARIGPTYSFVASFDRDGKFKDLVKLDVPFVVGQVAPFRSGMLLVSGQDRETHEPKVALADEDGRFVRTVHLEGDITEGGFIKNVPKQPDTGRPTNPPAVQFAGLVTGSSMFPDPEADEVVLIRNLQAGVPVFAVAPSGEVRVVRPRAPDGYGVESMFPTKEGWITMFSRDLGGNRIAPPTLCVMDRYTGEANRCYDTSETGTGLACYNGTDFLFLKYNIESKRYQLLVATPE